MIYTKNGKLKKVKGGYIVTYDKSIEDKDAYMGTSHIGNKEEVFVDGSKALHKIDEIYISEMKYNKMMMNKKKESKEEEYE